MNSSADVLSTTAALPSTPIRLDGTNFLLWKTLILPNLSGLNLHGHLDGSSSAPEKYITEGDGATARTKPNPAYQLWWQQDQRVLGVLLNSMSPAVATQMVGISLAAEVWTAVHGMFAAQNRATIRHTRLQLQTMKKGDLPAAEFYHRMKTLADTLASIGAPISDDDLIDYVLAGLGPQFGPLAASLTIANKTVTLPDFYAYLLSFEALHEQHHTTDWSSSANAVNRQFNGSGRRSPRRNDASSNRDRRPFQPRSNNRSNGDSNSSRGGFNRNRSDRNRSRPKCQICKLFGHEAITCHNRFNEAYNSEDNRTASAADRSSNANAPWFVDSGATDHLTSDLDRLTVHERYTGNDQVQVANGAGQSHTADSAQR